MSKPKKPKPRVRFCWACSRKLYGVSHVLRVIDGCERILHATCAYEIDNGIEVMP